MVTTFYPPFHFGGDAVFTFRLSNALAARGHEVHVIHCADAYELLARGRGERAVEHHPAVRIHTLRSRLGALSPLLTQQTGRMMLKKESIQRLFESESFDVINYHNVSLVGGMEVLGAGSAVKLYTMHEYWLICPTHIMFRNRDHPCESPKCFRCQLVHRRPPQLWRRRGWMRAQLAGVDRFLVSSRFAADLHRQRGLELKTEILPLFCELPGRDPAAAPPVPAGVERYFLYVGRLERLKGLQDVIPAFRRRPALHLLVAGEGDDEAALRELAGDSPNIHFLGVQGFGELASLYRGAIATLIPSRCYEIHPQVMGESWSCGTPVLVRGIGTMREAVDESGGGLHFASADELAAQVDMLAGDPSLARRLGELGHAAYLAQRTPERYLNRYFRIIDEVRAEHRTRVNTP